MTIPTTARRVIAGAISCGLAITICLSGAPANASAPSPSTSTDSGLFGASDPTYTGVYRQSLSILALTAAGTTIPTESINWLLGQQCTDGGFQGYKPGGVDCSPTNPTNYASEDSNTTGMALQALSALGQQAAAQKAADWLVAHQNTDHGFAYYPSQTTPQDSDANSTAVVLMGLNAFNAFAASRNPPATGYATETAAAKAFLQTLQPATCPVEGAIYEGAFKFQAGLEFGPSANYATVQASFAIGDHLLTDNPFTGPTFTEATFACTTPTVVDPYDPALVSAGYISRWIDIAAGDPFANDPSDEPAWAALSLLASSMGPQSSIDTAASAMHATVGSTSKDPGDIAMDILVRHAEPGATNDAEHAAIPGLVSRLLATLAPVAASSPAVSGTVAVGQTVACSPGVWNKSPNGFTYTWYRGASTVIARTYALRLTPALVSQTIRCAVTATNSHGSTTVSSAARKVAVGTLTNIGLPRIVGSARVGGYLAATSGAWSQLPNQAKYVWKRGNTVVGTGIGYRVKQADRGKKLVVVVTVTRPGYTGTATSKPRTVR
jgi:hypothetical protein